MHPDQQSSSYDNEYCWWSNIPDVDFAADEAYGWMTGQFVWTGFDYLGEPTPYDTEAWPSHSSVFGIIDLASIPKDRFYLYRSVWNRDEATLHVLPHWNWKGHEGRNVPVMVYTSWPAAELFVNGVSQGIARKDTTPVSEWKGILPDDRTLMGRYRLIWPDVVYQPGEIKVLAYDNEGRAVAEETVRTAGKAYSLRVARDGWNEGGENYAGVADPELIYLNVSVLDKAGNIVPDDTRSVSVKVGGAGKFKAIGNGDATSLESFQEPRMHLFSGQLTIIAERTVEGPVTVEVTAKGLKSSKITF